MFENIKKTFSNLISRKSLSSLHSIVPFRLSSFKRSWSPSDYLEAYEISLYANKAIEKRAEKVGEIEFLLMQGDKEVENNDLLSKLYKPNLFQTGREFWGLWQKYYDIFGEVYIWVDGGDTMTGTKRINAMHLLRSDMCKPFFDKDTGRIKKLEYQTMTGTRTYEGDEILYWNRPDPKNPLRGMSLLTAGIRAIETGIQVDEYHAKVLQNGGRVEGIFNIKHSNLTQQQLTDLKDQYDSQYAEAKNAGRPLFLGGDIDYKNVGLTPTELSYLQTKKVTLEDILILTGVPKPILGSMDDIKFDNADASTAIFLKETIKPLLTTLVSKLDEFMFPENLDLTFIDPTPENVDMKLKLIDSGMKFHYMTANEARALVDMEAIEGGDELNKPFSFGDFNFGDTPNDEEDETDDTEAKQKVMYKGEEFVHPLRDPVNRRAYEKLAIKRQDRQKAMFLKVLIKYMADQRERLLESISPENKHVFRKKDLIDEVFDLQLEISLAKEAVLPVLESLIVEAGVNAQIFAGSDFEFQVTSQINSWLSRKSDKFAKSITDTTFKKLKGEFSQSLEAGESRPELVDRIKNTYDNISKGRAEVIAQTEVQGVTQFATLEAYQQAGLPIKVWVSVGDGRVRDSHASVDGEERPVNQPFSNGLMHPADISGSAEEVINCRCVI